MTWIPHLKNVLVLVVNGTEWNARCLEIAFLHVRNFYNLYQIAIIFVQKKFWYDLLPLLPFCLQYVERFPLKIIISNWTKYWDSNLLISLNKIWLFYVLCRQNCDISLVWNVPVILNTHWYQTTTKPISLIHFIDWFSSYLSPISCLT